MWHGSYVWEWQWDIIKHQLQVGHSLRHSVLSIEVVRQKHEGNQKGPVTVTVTAFIIESANKK